MFTAGHERVDALRKAAWIWIGYLACLILVVWHYSLTTMLVDSPGANGFEWLLIRLLDTTRSGLDETHRALILLRASPEPRQRYFSPS